MSFREIMEEENRKMGITPETKVSDLINEMETGERCPECFSKVCNNTGVCCKCQTRDSDKWCAGCQEL